MITVIGYNAVFLFNLLLGLFCKYDLTFVGIFTAIGSLLLPLFSMFKETWYFGREEYEKQGMLPLLEEVFEKKNQEKKAGGCFILLPIGF
jgi:hypothetical protein